MAAKYRFNPISFEFDMVGTNEQSFIPKFDGIIDRDVEALSQSPENTDGAKVMYISTMKIFVLETDTGYYRNWANVKDYMTAWNGTPVMDRLFEYAGNYYKFDGKNLVLQP